MEIRLVPANVDILSYHADVPAIPNYPNGQFLTGSNLQETILTPANVNATNFGRLFSQPVDGYTFAQPLYKASLTIAGGTHNVVFFATEHDSVYAFDADSATAGPGGNGLYWQRSFIDPTNGITSVPNGDVGTGDIVPEVGITGSPVIDGATNTLYVVAKTKEVRGDGNHYVQTLHALNIATGADRVTPYVIGDSKGDGFANQTSVIQVAGNGADSLGGQIKFNAFREHQRPSLTLLGGRVYVGWASHGDNGPYHGWVVGFNETTLQPEKWFNTSPNARGSGIWQSQGAISTDGTFLYFAVGNAFGGPNDGFDPAHGNYGEAVLKIDPRPAGTAIAVTDYFVPNDWRQLDSADADLGSGGVMLLPDSVGSTAHPHLMIETGKSGKIYLIDRDNLGQNVPQGQADRVVQIVTAGPGGVWGNPGYYQESVNSGLVYYHGSGADSRAFRISNGMFTPASPIFTSGQGFGFPGAQPTLTANGQDNTTAIDWELQSDNYGQQGPEVLHAYAARPATGTTMTELFNSNQTGLRDRLGGSVKFTTVTVSNGHVFTTEEFRVSVFGLFPTHTTAPGAPSMLTATPVSDTSIRLNWTNPTPNNATGIEIYRSTTDNMHYALVTTVPAGAASYLDTGLSPTGTYFYHIRAVNQAGASAFSNEVQGNPAISPPVLSFDNVCSNAISLVFTRPGVANDHYEVQRSTNGGMTFGTIATLPGNQTSYTDSNLTPGSYQYRIRAFTAPTGGMSVDSNIVQTRIGAGSAIIDYFNGFPPSPFDLQSNGSAQFAETTARLTNANAQAGSVFSTGKKSIIHWTSDFNVRLHEGTQPSYADGFAFVIQANSPSALGQGNGGLGYQGIPNSVAIKFQTFSTTAEPGNSTGIFFNGDRPTVAGQPGEENIVLNPAQVNLQSQSTKAITLSYDDATHILHEMIVDPDHPTTPFTHDYTVDLPSKLGSVSAGNSVGYVGFTGSTGTGGFWELQDVTKWRFTPIGPAAPALRVANTSATAIDLAWRCNSADEQGFRVLRATSPNGPFNQLAQVGAGVTTYHDTMVTAGTAYYYRVQAFNADGNSGFSNTATAVAAPGILIAHDGGFATHTDIQVNGNAFFPPSPPVLRITDAVNGQASSAYFTTRVGTGPFSTTFVLRDQPGTGAADSLSFVIQSDPRGLAALGGGGGDGGYGGIQHSVALKFDLYTHNTHNPSTGLFINGQSPAGFPAQDVPLAPINLGSGHPLRVDLIYDGTSLSQMVTDSVTGQTFSHTYMGNLAQVIGSGAGYVGFTGGTGGENAIQDIVSWTGQFSQPTPAATLTVSGFPSPIQAGTPGTFTVTAKDANGFVVPGYVGTVHFTSSDGAAMLPTNYTFTAADNGSHTFTATLNTQGTQSITATDTVTMSITGTQAGIVVAPPSPCDTVDHSAGFYVHNDLRANGTASFPGAPANPTGVFASHQDIGTPGDPSTAGTATFDAALGKYTVTASGSDIWDTTDHMQYLYRPLNGDGEIIARLTAASATDFFTKGGLMIRESLDPGARNAFMLEFGPNGGHNAPTFQWRANQGGMTMEHQPPQGTQAAPVWLRLNRTGNLFTGYWAQDLGGGTHGGWLQSGSETVPMGTSALVGLALTSHNNGQVATDTFDNLTVTPTPPVPLRLVDGGDGQAGSAFTTGVVRVSTFNTSFTFQPRVGNNAGAPLADGLTFTIQRDPRGNAALGSSGGALGYAQEGTGAPGITPSVAVKFDFWKPNGDHSSTGLYFNGQHPDNDAPPPNVFRDLAGSPINFNANARGTPPHTYKVDLDYDGTTLNEKITDLNGPAGANSFTTSYTVNIPMAVGGGTGYVGFTAGTGGADSIIDIQSWTGMFCVPYGPTTHFAVTGFPNPTLAGTAGNFTVSALDDNNRVTPAYRGTVHFTSSDGMAMLPMNYTFTTADAGTHQFTATLKTLGTQSITATDTVTATINGSQTGILVQGPCDTVDHSAGFASHGDLRSNGNAQFTGTVLRLIDGGSGEAASAFTTSRLRASAFNTSFTFQPRGGSPIADGLTFTIQNDPRGAGALGSGGGALGYAFEGGGAAITPSIAVKFDFWKPNGNHSSTGLYFNGQHPDNDAPPPNVFRDLAGSPIDFNNSAQLNPPHSYRVDLAYDGTTLRETITDLNKPAGMNSFSTSYTVNIPAVLGGGTGYVGFTAGDGGATSTIDIQNWTGMFCIPSGPATHFTVSGFPSPTTAGTAGNFTVTALDANNLVAYGYRGTVHFTSSDSQAMLPMDYTFTAADDGVHQFTATLKTAGTQSITAIDTMTATINGSQTGIVVNPAAASTLMVSGFPSPATAGVAGNFTVTAKDAYGNTATGYRGMVHFTSSDVQAMLPMNYTFVAGDNGVHQFSATLKTVGSQSITATDTVTMSITGTQAGIIVNPGPVAQLSVAGFPSPTQARAVHFFTVIAQDAFGNRATNYRGTVHFSSTDPQAFLPSDYTFTDINNGAVILDAAFLTAGSQTLTATDTTANVTGSQTGIVVTPAAANHFTLTVDPSTITAGQTTMATLTAFDPYGNVATGYLGTVHFTSSDAQATLPDDYTFTAGDAGQHTFPATLRTTAAYGPGPQTITATDLGQGFAATAMVIVSPAAATSFVIRPPDCGCSTAGQQFAITVFAIDPYGNIDVNYSGTVHFDSSDAQASLPADHDFTLDGGFASFAVTLFTAGDQTITATDTNDSTITGTGTVTVTPAAATHFVLTAPGRVEMGVAFNLTVTAYDPYGNIDYNYVGTVHFDSSDPDAVLPADYTFQPSDGGVATFGVILNTPTDQTITATDTSDSTITGTITINVFVSGGGSPGTGGHRNLDRTLAVALTGPRGSVTFANAGVLAESSTPRLGAALSSADQLQREEPSFSTAAHTAALDSLLANWDGDLLPSLLADDLVKARLS